MLPDENVKRILEIDHSQGKYFSFDIRRSYDHNELQDDPGWSVLL